MTEQVYVVGSEGMPAVKIGTTTKIAGRIRQLQTSHSHQLDLLWSRAGGRELERALHVRFHEYRKQGEWFDLSELGDPAHAVEYAAKQICTPGSQNFSLARPGTAAIGPLLWDCARIERELRARTANLGELDALALPSYAVLIVTEYVATQCDVAGKAIAYTSTIVVGEHPQLKGYGFPQYSPA